MQDITILLRGRFTTKDNLLGTIPNPLSRNLYTYVENNPLNYIDPSGHAPLRTDPMRNMPLISPVDQMKIDNQIAKQSFHPLDGINAATHPGGPKAYYDEKIENVYGEHFFGKGYSNPTGPYRLKTDSSLGHVSSKKEAKTKLQKAIDDRKINLYKTYCENGAQKAKDDGELDRYSLDKNSREYLIEALERAKSDITYQPYLDMIDSIINSLKSGNEVVDLGNGVKVQINLNKNYSTKGDQLIKEFAGFIPVLGELMELVDFMDTDNSSLSDLGDSAASSSIGGLAKFLEKNDNSFLSGLGKTLGKITNIYNVVKITEIVFDKNDDKYQATEIQIVLQRKDSSSSHLYQVVIDKDGNFKKMYSGYAGDVIKDDKYFEVITQ